MFCFRTKSKKRFLIGIIKLNQVNLLRSVLQIMEQKKARGLCAGGLVRLAQITFNTISIVNATQKTSNKMVIYSQ